MRLCIYATVVFACLVHTKAISQKIGTNVVLTTQEEVNAFDYDIILYGLTIGGTPNPTNCYNRPCTPITDLSPIAGTVFSGSFASLHIGANPQLKSLAGLEDILIDGFFGTPGLSISNNPLLVDLSGLRNINIKEGKLIISNNASLSSLKGIGNITVRDNVEITNNSALVDLNGFENFVMPYFGAQLRITNNPSLKSLDGIQNVRSAADVIVSSNPSLTSLRGISNITFDSADLTIEKNDNLVTLDGLKGISIIRAGSELTIQDNPRLENLSGISNVIAEQVTIQRNPSLKSLQGIQGIDLSKGSQIDVLDNPALIDLGNWSGVKLLGSIQIERNHSIKTLKGLSGLTLTGNFGTIAIRDNSGLTNLEGLENITIDGVGSKIEIAENMQITSLQGMKNIAFRTTFGKFVVGGNPELNSLIGINGLNLEFGEVEVNIQNNDKLIDLRGLTDFVLGKTRYGSLIIAGNKNLVSTAGIQNLITGESADIFIRDNPSLRDLTDLGNIQFARYSTLTIERNAALNDLRGLKNFRMVGEWGKVFKIVNNPALVSLSGLEDIEISGSGNEFIIENPTLTSLAGLSGVSIKNDAVLKITNNPMLNDLVGLENIEVTGSVIIENNPGLKNLHGMKNIIVDSYYSGSGIILDGNPNLENISGMVNMSVNRFNLLNNPKLKSLAGIDSLKSKLSLRIFKNSGLINIDDIEKLNIEQVQVMENEKLSSCCCLNKYLERPQFGFVDKNGIGCRNAEEVQSNCSIYLEVYNIPPFTSYLRKSLPSYFHFNIYDKYREPEVLLGWFSHDAMELPTIRIPTTGNASTRIIVKHKEIEDVNLEMNSNGAPVESGSLRKVADSVGVKVYELIHPASADFEGTSRVMRIDVVKNGAVTRSIPFTVVRPPLVMVHGRSSGRYVFSEMVQELVEKKKYEDYQIVQADYKNTSLLSFAANQEVIPTGIRLSYLRSVDRNESFGGVTIVGHSMGGILARRYLQSSMYAIGKDVRSVISINSPHSGSHLAKPMPSIVALVKGLKLIDGDIGVVGAADYDLGLDSEEIAELRELGRSPSDDVPSHAITTTFDPYTSTFDDNANGYYRVLNLINFLSSIGSTPLLGSVPAAPKDYPGRYFSDFNDLVVSLKSQQGGLRGGHTSRFDDDHSSTENPTVINQITQLLDAPTNGPLYNSAGFSPEVLNYSSQEAIRDANLMALVRTAIELIARNSAGRKRSEGISASFSPGSVSPGEDIVMTLENAGSIDYYAVIGSNLFVAADSISVGKADVRCPTSEYKVGRVNFSVLGFKNGQLVIVLQDLSHNVETNERLESVRFALSKPTITVGDTLYLKVYGSFSDGVERDISDIVTAENLSSYYRRFKFLERGLVALSWGNDFVTVSIGGLTAQTEVLVHSKPQPAAEPPFVDLLLSTATLKLDEDLFFRGVTNIDNCQWSWRFPGAATESISGDAGRIFYTEPGRYDVEVYITGDTTLTIKKKAAITVTNCISKPKIKANGDLILCEGESLTLTGPDQRDYKWSTGATTQQITVVSPGKYTLSVTSGEGCTVAASDTLNVVVLPKPTIELTNIGNVLNASGASSYTWFRNGEVIEDFGGQQLEVASGGAYHVEGANMFGCLGISPTVPVQIVSILEDEDGGFVNIYPNPAIDEVTVDFSRTYHGVLEIKVFNSIGGEIERLVDSKGITDFSYTIKFRNISTGIYTVRAMVDGKLAVRRLLITK